MLNHTEGQQSVSAAKIQHLTEDELIEVLECARRTSSRDHALLCVTYWHALRNQEIAQLRLSDISWNDQTISIQRKKSSMHTVQAIVRVKGNPAKCEWTALKTWLKERDSASEYVFTSSRDASCLGQKQINRIFSKYCQLASDAREKRGLPRIAESACHIHVLKHSLLK